MIISLIIIILFLCFFGYCSLYLSMTHMNDDELEWVTNREEGEIMRFRSQDGADETAVTTGITVSNSKNPFNRAYPHEGRQEFKARAEVRYELGDKRNEGSFRIWKGNNDEPITFSTNLGRGWVWRTPLDTITLTVEGITLNDVMYFDNESGKDVYDIDDILIKNYYWSRKYGLVQYTYSDGTVFTRTDID